MRILAHGEVDGELSCTQGGGVEDVRGSRMFGVKDVCLGGGGGEWSGTKFVVSKLERKYRPIPPPHFHFVHFYHICSTFQEFIIFQKFYRGFMSKKDLRHFAPKRMTQISISLAKRPNIYPTKISSSEFVGWKAFPPPLCTPGGGGTRERGDCIQKLNFEPPTSPGSWPPSLVGLLLHPTSRSPSGASGLVVFL